MPADIAKKKFQAIADALKNFFPDEYYNPDLNKLKESLQSPDAATRRSALDVLSDLADISRPASVNLEDFIDILINNLSIEYELVKNKGLHFNFIDTLDTLSNILILVTLKNSHDWNKILPYLDEPIKDGELDYVLAILSCSHNIEYIPLLEKYLQHPSQLVRSTAQSGIDEINNSGSK